MRKDRGEKNGDRITVHLLLSSSEETSLDSSRLLSRILPHKDTISYLYIQTGAEGAAELEAWEKS